MQDFRVDEFWKGSIVLLTGATGFVGTCLLAKLLTPHLRAKRVYVLVRGPNGRDRVKEMLDSSAFSSLRNEIGDNFEAFVEKQIYVVEGFIEKFGLGLSEADASVLQEEVDVCIHAAATTGFLERLDVSLRVNTLGTFHTLKFAESCPKLRGFVCVGTAYVNPNVKEAVPEASLTKRYVWEDDLLENMKLVSDASIGKSRNLARQMGLNFAKKRGFHNIYTFSKAAAEVLVERHRASTTPVAMMRPSMIVRSVEFPYAGWKSANAKTFFDDFLISWIRGHLPVRPVKRSSVFDIVPVDMVVDAILAGGAQTVRAEKESGVHYFHISSNQHNPFTCQMFMDCIDEYVNNKMVRDAKLAAVGMNSIPPIPMYMPPSLCIQLQTLNTVTLSVKEHLIRFVIKLHLHSIGLREGQAMLRKKEKVSESRFNSKKRKMILLVYKPYFHYRSKFQTDGIERLLQFISKDESQYLSFDTKSIDWRTYLLTALLPDTFETEILGKPLSDDSKL